MKTFETERLIIRPITEDDASFFLELMNTPTFLENIGDRGLRSVEDARAYLRNGPLKSYEENGFGICLLVLKDGGTPIGNCGLIKREGLDEVDIGFALMPGYEGKGYGYESASVFMDFAKRDLGLKRIVAITLPSNKSSIHLLEKLGLTFEKMFKLPGDDEDLMLFGCNLS